MDVMLRDVIDSDLPVFFEHQADPVSSEMAGVPSRPLEAFLAHWKKIRADQMVILKTIVYKEQVAGIMMSFPLDGKRQVGYWIDQQLWGKGITTQALKDFLRELKIRPLYAHVVKHNAASLRVLEKCGFQIIGEVPAPNAGGAEPDMDYVLELK